MKGVAVKDADSSHRRSVLRVPRPWPGVLGLVGPEPVPPMPVGSATPEHQGTKIPGEVEEEVPLSRAMTQTSTRPSVRRPVVPKLSLRGVFREKERAGEYKLKMDYKDPQFSELLMDEAIEVLLRKRYRVVEEVKPPTQSLWVRLFGGCLVEAEDKESRSDPVSRPALIGAKTAANLGISVDTSTAFI
ncbi:unnamed protein product [Durusdinium trenchii]|uniref:Uncharacterized protein n=1 Tax=Durusdinium trenchii TaxID=1381693 RepID=A0ABP0HH28_9DINO